MQTKKQSESLYIVPSFYRIDRYKEKFLFHLGYLDPI